MNRFTFIFVVCIYALFLIYQAFSAITLEQQLVYASFFILLFGIPHGAIDHILFFRKKSMTQLKFYGLYLGLIVLFVLLWLKFPLISFLFFLILSAFHFGESQFVDAKLTLRNFNPLLFLFWGLALLATLMYYNISELAAITAYFQDTQNFGVVYNEDLFFYFFTITNITTLVLLIYLFVKNQMSIRRLSSELFLIALIHLTFFLFPFIIGFTLYFVVLHSIRVMNQEYLFFKSEDGSFSLVEFLKLLLPYSLLSIFFTSVLLALSHLGYLAISIPFLSIIIISVITLPHAIVMHIFYNK
jgi:Brp/Blh family beta-carotene 15,15'-monooxygenase